MMIRLLLLTTLLLTIQWCNCASIKAFPPPSSPVPHPRFVSVNRPGQLKRPRFFPQPAPRRHVAAAAADPNAALPPTTTSRQMRFAGLPQQQQQQRLSPIRTHSPSRALPPDDPAIHRFSGSQVQAKQQAMQQAGANAQAPEENSPEEAGRVVVMDLPPGVVALGEGGPNPAPLPAAPNTFEPLVP